MTIDFNDPAVKEAIELKATEIAEATVQENYVPASDIEGLKNKNTELLGKLAKNKEKFANVDESDLAELVRVKSAREHDKFVDMVLKGNTEEAKATLTEGLVTPWKQKVDDIQAQFEAAQTEIGNYKSQVTENQTKISNMQKRQYLRELTGGDDSFKADHFDDFYMLNSNKMEIDAETGNVYALKDGKAVLDTEGNRVTFSDAYEKQKVANGLFWNGGTGSGAKGTSGDGSHLGSDVTKWTSEQKNEFIRDKGPKAYGELYAAALAK